MTNLSDYVLVLREPDAHMICKGLPEMSQHGAIYAEACYRAMTAASPPLCISDAEMRDWFRNNYTYEEIKWYPNSGLGYGSWDSEDAQTEWHGFRAAFKLLEQAGWLTIKGEK